MNEPILENELNSLLDGVTTGETTRDNILSDCRVIAKSYGLGYGYVIRKLQILSRERAHNT